MDGIHRVHVTQAAQFLLGRPLGIRHAGKKRFGTRKMFLDDAIDALGQPTYFVGRRQSRQGIGDTLQIMAQRLLHLMIDVDIGWGNPERTGRGHHEYSGQFAMAPE
ncbi:MAG: hypothetical protein CMN73_03765 [Sphingomonas sp.]|nr:hypothetical protein [Sphingomonas sp.]|tara:strand:- start:1737 stop:2054 length:318 start_codon:yes stop_codon:yes gene_type:complete